jgi:hypothetical protein
MTLQRYVALVRGINVGRAKRVAMADLRKLVSDLGYEDVRSLLNSGNIVFSAPTLAPGQAAAAIEDALVLKLGVAARVTVLSSSQLSAIVSDNSLLALAIRRCTNTWPCCARAMPAPASWRWAGTLRMSGVQQVCSTAPPPPRWASCWATPRRRATGTPSPSCTSCAPMARPAGSSGA